MDSPASVGKEANERALVARGLVKAFGDLVAVNGLDLEVRAGTCLALLGPNGAGKTTTIEMLEGLQRPDSGEIELLGRNWNDHAEEIRTRIGVQLQETKLQEKLTVVETLRLFQSFYSETRTLDEALEIVGLDEKRTARIETLSGGQHQRLSLACALINRPDLLFLDEPSTGLDPQARRRVWEVVEAFKKEGGTVLLTTHYMEEAQRLADEVVIVDRGRVIERGSPAEVIGRLEAENIVELFPKEGSAEVGELAEIEALPGVRSVRREGSALVLDVVETQAAVGALLAHLQTKGVELQSLQTHAPTLEDVFVAHTGKQLRDS
ncbi:MAG: ABC transporter ATP-binding protein [Planctomycetota bacterium]